MSPIILRFRLPMFRRSNISVFLRCLVSSVPCFRVLLLPQFHVSYIPVFPCFHVPQFTLFFFRLFHISVLLYFHIFFVSPVPSHQYSCIPVFSCSGDSLFPCLHSHVFLGPLQHSLSSFFLPTHTHHRFKDQRNGNEHRGHRQLHHMPPIYYFTNLTT